MSAKGLAHRGQYGDGRLTATAGFVVTAHDVVTVKAHTGHAVHLARDGVVMGTGGNRFGPLSSHGLGDKAFQVPLPQLLMGFFLWRVALKRGLRYSILMHATYNTFPIALLLLSGGKVQ